MSIKLLSEVYNDYQRKPWYYDNEYKMLVKAQDLVKENISSINKNLGKVLTKTDELINELNKK